MNCSIHATKFDVSIMLRFTLDYKVKEGEDAYLNQTGTPMPAKDLIVVQVIAHRGDGTSTISPQNGGVVRDVPTVSLEKIGGRFHINTFVMKDGKDILSLNLSYSNENSIIGIENVSNPGQHLMLNGIVCGGKKKKNQRQHCVVLEQERRKLEKDGEPMPGRWSVTDPATGKEHILHDPTFFVNQLFELPDQIQFEFDTHMMGQRSPKALAPLIANCEARSLRNRAVWLYLDNMKMKVRSEASSTAVFAKAEELRGTKEWDQHARRTGARGQTLAEIGDPRIGLDPAPSRSVSRRFAHEAAHEDGILDNNMRDAIIQLAPVELVKRLMDSMNLHIQPSGTKPMFKYLKQTTAKKPKTHFSGEKLMGKRAWRRHRLISDLIPLTQDDEELRAFVETWHLNAMVGYLPGGVSMEMADGWEWITKSMMLQYEWLAITRDHRLLKACSITYVAFLFVFTDLCLCVFGRDPGCRHIF